MVYTSNLSTVLMVRSASLTTNNKINYRNIYGFGKPLLVSLKIRYNLETLNSLRKMIT